MTVAIIIATCALLTISLMCIIVPGVVRNLICARSSTPTELSFSWELPIVLGSEVVGYRVEVKGLHHRDGTREVVQFDVDGFNTDRKEATISQGLGNVGLDIECSQRLWLIPCSW